MANPKIMSVIIAGAVSAVIGVLVERKLRGYF